MIDVRVTDPSGIANAIIVARREVQAEGGSVRADAAVRLMVTRLASVCGATGEPEDYPQLVAVCRRARSVGDGCAGGRLEAVRPEPASLRGRRSVMSAKGELIGTP
jgi:hypothetical protein